MVRKRLSGALAATGFLLAAFSYLALFLVGFLAFTRGSSWSGAAAEQTFEITYLVLLVPSMAGVLIGLQTLLAAPRSGLGAFALLMGVSALSFPWVWWGISSIGSSGAAVITDDGTAFFATAGVYAGTAAVLAIWLWFPRRDT